MASTYSSLKIQLMGTGDNSGTWGDVTNTNLGTAIEEAITGYGTANFSTDAALTLTLTDTNTAQTARNLVLNVTSGVSLTATQNLVVPTIEKQYYVFNNTSGGQAINVKTSAGTGVIVPNGGKAVVFVDGVNVVPAINSLPVSATVTYKLPTTDGTNGDVLATNGTGTLSWYQIPTVVPGSDNVGYQNVPQNSQSANYTLVLSDSGKHIYHPSADTTARTFTIPANASVAFPIGTAIGFVNDTGAGVVTIAITSDTLIAAGTGLTGSRTLATSSIATAIKITSTKWMISGNSLT
jgi:hypothetical protein